MYVERFTLLLLSITFICNRTYCSKDSPPVVYFPPFELRAVQAEKKPFMSGPNIMPQQGQPHASHFQNMVNPMLQSQLMPQIQHNNNVENMEMSSTSNVAEVKIAPLSHKTPHEDTTINSTQSVSVHDLLSALGLSDHEDKVKEHERAATAREYEYPSYPSYSRPPPEYGYPSHGYWPPPNYHESPYAYIPPTYAHQSGQPSYGAPLPQPQVKPFSIFKPLPEKLPEVHSLVKPVASKLASKVGGFIGLLISLLTGSSTDDGELKGLKDIIINGVVKPLLLAKGGIKTLISKLAIPVIVVLLMNLEVLVLIWWLWEDCSSEPVHAPPVYPYPKPVTNYGYNSYG